MVQYFDYLYIFGTIFCVCIVPCLQDVLNTNFINYRNFRLVKYLEGKFVYENNACILVIFFISKLPKHWFSFKPFTSYMDDIISNITLTKICWSSEIYIQALLEILKACMKRTSLQIFCLAVLKPNNENDFLTIFMKISIL